MFYRLLAFNLLIFCFIGNCIAQGNKKVFIAMDDLESTTIGELSSTGVKQCKIIYGDFIYPKKSHALVTDVFVREIERLFPNKNSNGFGLFDWEGDLYYDIIFDKASSKEKSYAVSQFLKAIHIAKKLRPNVKWGFYGLPNPKYLIKNKHSNQTIRKVLNKTDFVVPVIYISSPNNIQKQESYFNQIKSLVNGIDVPVYPIVWDRYNSLDSKYRRKLIPSDVLNTYISTILNQDIFDGLIYWGKDTWFYSGNKNIDGKNIDAKSFKRKYNKRVISNVRLMLKK